MCRLLRSEARHFEDYLALAEQVAGEDIQSRVQYFLELEKKLIETRDQEFAFSQWTAEALTRHSYL